MVIDFDNDNGCADADWHERTEGMGVAVCMAARHWKVGSTDGPCPDFVNTSPFYIHESRPLELDLEVIAQTKPWPLPSMLGGVPPQLDGPYRLTWRERVRAFFSAAWWG